MDAIQVEQWLYEYLDWLKFDAGVEIDGKPEILKIYLEDGECIIKFPLFINESDKYAGFAGY